MSHSARALVLALAAVVATPAASAIAQAQAPPAKSVSVFYLKNAVAAEAERVITELYSDHVKMAKLRVVADARTNALYVTAATDLQRQLADLIKTIDTGKIAKPKAPEQNDSVKIFTLQHLDAGQAMSVVQKMVTGKVRVVAEQRTNSVLATGPEHELAMIEALLMKLDRPSGKPRQGTQVISLKHIGAEKAMKTLVDMGTVSGVIAADAKRNRLILKGTEKDVRLVQELIRLIDLDNGGANPQMQLRIVWLVHEKLAGKDAADPPKDLDRVISAMKGKLVTGPLKLAAQVVVAVDSGDSGEFEASGTSSLMGSACRLNIQGKIAGHSQGKPLLAIQLSAEGPGPRGEQFATISTRIAAPRGHSVVLGMTPIRSLDSVFVLQMLPVQKTVSKK